MIKHFDPKGTGLLEDYSPLSQRAWGVTRWINEYKLILDWKQITDYFNESETLSVGYSFAKLKNKQYINGIVVLVLTDEWLKLKDRKCIYDISEPQLQKSTVHGTVDYKHVKPNIIAPIFKGKLLCSFFVSFSFPKSPTVLFSVSF